MRATLRLRAELAALPALSQWVDAQVAGLDAHQAYALRLCVEELAGNVLLHGAAGTLQVIVDGPPLSLVVEDDGPAFDPSAVRRAASSSRFTGIILVGGDSLALWLTEC